MLLCLKNRLGLVTHRRNAEQKPLTVLEIRVVVLENVATLPSAVIWHDAMTCAQRTAVEPSQQLLRGSAVTASPLVFAAIRARLSYQRWSLRRFFLVIVTLLTLPYRSPRSLLLCCSDGRI